MITRIRFEHIFALIILGVLSLGFFFCGDSDMKSTILTALVGGLSAITAFFFTKHNPAVAAESSTTKTTTVEPVPQTPEIKTNAVETKEVEQATNP